MQITTSTYRSISLTDEVLGDVELPFEPTDSSDVFVSPDIGTFTYLVYAPDTCDDYEFGEGVEFVTGKRDSIYHCDDADAFFDKYKDDPNYSVFPVGVYEHGGIQYTLAGESIHANDQWDYCVGAAIAIPHDFTNPEEAARAILNEFTSWCNGDVYGIVTMVQNDYGEWEEGDTCWGFIGYDYAREEAKSWAGVE